MNKFIVAIAAFSIFSACGGDGTNPFDDEEEEEIVDPVPGRTMPPGTANPSPNSSIFRSEPTTGGQVGDGMAQDITYNAANDTFTVDNLAFDGDNIYALTTINKFGAFDVYEAAAQYTDPVNGSVINQFRHRLIYGISASKNTQFAIVRTGAYLGYGFGGFIYQRNNSVTLPTTGQAHYEGKTQGIRDFGNSGGLEFTTGDITIDIDFEDFNATNGLRGDAVRGRISNRRIYDTNGTDITATVLTRIETENNITLSAIPTATFVISPGVMDDNGEILGAMQSNYIDSQGNVKTFETGNYYAIVSGDDAGEIVGIFVLQSTIDPIGDVRETGGFIVYR